MMSASVSIAAFNADAVIVTITQRLFRYNVMGLRQAGFKT